MLDMTTSTDDTTYNRLTSLLQLASRRLEALKRKLSPSRYQNGNGLRKARYDLESIREPFTFAFNGNGKHKDLALSVEKAAEADETAVPKEFQEAICLGFGIAKYATLVSLSSGVVLSMLEDKAFQQNNVEVGEFFRYLPTEFKEKLERAIGDAAQEFWTNFEQGEFCFIDRLIEGIEARRLADEDVNAARLVWYNKFVEKYAPANMTNPETRTRNITPDSYHIPDSYIEKVCNVLIAEIKSYPTSPEITKKEQLLELFRNAPGHMAWLHTLGLIFAEDSTDPEKQAQRKLPQLNRQLEGFGVKIERQSVYKMVRIPETDAS